MREIKFRAWDTYKGQIIKCGEVGSLILSEVGGLYENPELLTSGKQGGTNGHG